MSVVKKELIALYIIQIANFAIPLVTMPYLTNVLGINNFGKIGYFNALIALMGFFIDFGFGMSASRSVAIAKPEQIEHIYTNVQTIRILLLLVTNAVFYIYCTLTGGLDFPYYLLMLSTLAMVFTPSWIFMGLSQNSILAKLTLINKILLLIPLFILIKSKMDYVRVMILYTMSSMIVAACSTYIISQKFKFKFKLQYVNISLMRNELSYSSQIFSASFFTLGHTYLTPIILKHFVGDAAVGLYSILERGLLVLRQVYSPISNVFYPKICQLFANQDKFEIKLLNRKVFYIYMLIGVSAFLGNYFLGDYLLGFLFPAVVYQLVDALNISILTQIVISIAMILVNFVILPSGNANIIKYFYFFGFCLYMFMIFALKDILKLSTVLYLILLLEILLTTCFYLFIKRKKILI